jgi:hypothetical protein
MKRGRKDLSAVILIFMAVSLMGQSKKIIREKGIISMTVNEYFIEEGMDEPVVETIEKYNKEGELIEIHEFNKRGEMKKWEKSAYDTDGNRVEEIYLDEKGKITSTEKNIFRDSLRVGKQYYDPKGRLVKKKLYVYEYSQ